MTARQVGAASLVIAASIVAAVPARTAAPRLEQGRGAVPTFTVAVNTTTIESAPVFVAVGDAPGVAIQLISGGIAQLAGGEADAATNAETQAILRSIANPNIRIVLTVAECTYRIVARRSAGIVRVADLRGKKIATASNTSAHFYLAKTLRGAGLAEADVIVVPMRLSEMPAALKRGDVDAVSIWEPGAQNSIEAVGADAVILQDRAVYRERFNLNTTSEVLGDPAKRSALVNLVRALVRASERVASRPMEVWPLLASKINVSEPTIAAVWREFRFPASLPVDLLDVLVEEEQWAATAQKRAPRARAVLASLIDRSVLSDARR